MSELQSAVEIPNKVTSARKKKKTMEMGGIFAILAIVYASTVSGNSHSVVDLVSENVICSFDAVCLLLIVLPTCFSFVPTLANLKMTQFNATQSIFEKRKKCRSGCSSNFKAVRFRHITEHVSSSMFVLWR